MTSLALLPHTSTDPQRVCGKRTRNGRTCRSFAIQGGMVCRMHGGGAPQVKAKAQERIKALAEGPAIDRIGYLIDHGETDTVRLAAARDMLDRAGLTASQKYEITGDAIFTLRIDRGDGDDIR